MMYEKYDIFSLVSKKIYPFLPLVSTFVLEVGAELKTNIYVGLRNM